MRFLLILIFIFCFPMFTSARLEFVSLLPNTEDDTNLEYVEIRNTSCTGVDVSGYVFSDASGKEYIFPSGMNIAFHANFRLDRSISKVILNNEDETIFLKRPDGTMEDEFSYATSTKGEIITDATVIDETCEIISDTSDSSGTTLSGMTNTGSEVSASGSGDNTGMPSDSGSINESTGTSGTGTSGTGTSGTGTSGTGTLIPRSLIYDDSDGNGKIDTIEILYDDILTGSVSVDSIFLYSNTGGLSTTRINTQTGFIISGFLSGNTLVLKLREGDIMKSDLHITNTTTSDLRLKSSGNLGFFGVLGDIPENFLLTTSFDSYRNVSKKSIAPEIPKTLSGSEIASGSTMSVFPEIVLTLQSPTNAIFSSGSFSCVESTCRINITIEPIFASGFSMRDVRCFFGASGALLEDSDCNPNTLYYSTGSELIVLLVSRSDSGLFREMTFPIFWNVVRSGSSNSIPTPNTIIDKNPPIAILEHDAKWKDYFFQNGENNLDCYAYTCSLNFTAEHSYDPEGGPVRFLWVYGLGHISESKDPGVLKYGLGDHRVILRVIDTSGNFSEVRYDIHVLGPREKEPKKEKQKSEKIVSKSEKMKAKSLISTAGKKSKKMKLSFFSPPEIVLQGKSGELLQENRIGCVAKRSGCSVNLVLTGVVKEYTYRWKLPDGSEFIGKNPKSWKLDPGTYTISIAAYHSKESTEAVWKKDMKIQVVQEPKKPPKKKPKKTKVTSSQKTKPSGVIIPSVQAASSTQENTRALSRMTDIFLFFGVFFVLFGVHFVNKKRKG